MALIAVTILLVGLTMWQHPAKPEEVKIGLKAPEIRLASLSGQDYKLQPPKGKALILHFWASWCKPCREEAVELNDFYERHKDRVEIYAVNLTAKDSIDDARKFADRYGLRFPVLLDEKTKAAERYRIAVLPTSYLIDSRGVVVGRKIGAFDRETLESQLPLLFGT